jgi:PAS domain S-box-containing protein
MISPHELKQRLSYLILGRRGGYNRIHIIEALKAKPSNINQLAAALNLNYRTVKHHISALIKHEIISTSRIGGYGEVYFISPELEGNMPVLDEIVKKLTTISTSPKFFQSLIEQTNDAIIILDDHLDILFWNNSAERLYGYKTEQVIAKRIPIFSDIALLTKTVDIIKEGKKASGFETDALHCDGKNLVVSVTIEGIKDEQDVLVGYSLISADITERKRFNEALRLSEERFTLAQRAAGIISWEWEPTTDAFILSDKFGSFIDLSPNQLGNTFKAYLKLIHPDDRSMVEKAITTAYQRKKKYSIEHRMVRPNGEVRWVSETGGVVRIGTGKVVRVLGIVQDITEHKRAENQLSYQSKLLNKVSDAIIATDERFNVTYWNPAAQAIYGWSSKEVMGKDLQSLVKSKFKGAKSKDVLKNLFDKGRFDGDVFQRRKNGTYIRVEAETISLKDGSGTIIGYMSVNRDVTELRKAENQRERSFDRLSQLSVKVSWTIDELDDILSPLPEPIILFDVDGRIITVNLAHSKLFGYSAKELAGQSPAMIHPEDVDKVQAALAMTASARKRTEVIARVVSKSGVTKDFAHMLAPVIRGDEVRSIVGIIREATQVTSESDR